MNKKQLLLILTGVSGSGKTTLCSHFLSHIPKTARVVTTTTRLPRPGEINGVDYYFEKEKIFLEKIRQGDFLEYAQVYGYHYGISKKAISQKSYDNKDLIICLDVQGAQTFKTQFDKRSMKHHLVTIFIAPASQNDLKQRLITRGTDDEQTIQKRLQTAETELQARFQFDYYLCSQDREHDWQCLQHIYFAEKMRV